MGEIKGVSVKGTGSQFGGGWIHECIAESLSCSLGTITTLLTSYIPIQNKKFLVFFFFFVVQTPRDNIMSKFGEFNAQCGDWK